LKACAPRRSCARPTTSCSPRPAPSFPASRLNEALWKQLKAYADTDEARQLEGVRKRFLTKTMADFRRSGADLDSAGKQRLQEIEVELSKLTTKFAENVLDATNAFELIIEDEVRLSGLPPSAREQARDSAKKKGKDGWRFTLQAPSYTAVMTYLDDRKVREQVWRAYSTRATKGEFDNRENIAKILQLRQEKARLLGYDNFADLALEERMAKKGRRAQEFVDDLEHRTRKAFERENKSLLEFRMSIEGAAAVHIDPVGRRLLRRKIAEDRLRLSTRRTSNRTSLRRGQERAL
jgi:oligopeptidase A